ncbi:MAG: phosphoenolpyruvate carboxykinase (GTP) [Waddliaceae bacterium]|nr:phosphoenolpyruvate carboxykinase (GTP) [Waddliaceae bacterium]
MRKVFSKEDIPQEGVLEAWTVNSDLISWVREKVSLCTPDEVYLCDGSDEEYTELCDLSVEKGSFIKLDETLRPNSYLVRSDPDDVARVESKTFICSESKEDAGPTNNWKDPSVMKHELQGKFSECMKGRTMYVIPFCMGPIGSPMSKIGVEISDSPYVVCNMKIMTRMGEQALDKLTEATPFIPCIHSVGQPLAHGEQDVPWPCNPDETCIAHFPETKEIWSFGSGYGGNALLGKKCLALRIASVMASEEGWLAEHMLILKITNSDSEVKFITGAFPSACGKTNLAMHTPTIPGCKVECVGDDIAWLHPGDDGKLYAINPEAGFFGVAPGTSMESNPNAMKSLTENCLFTNVALTPAGDVWWEGMTDVPPDGLIDWRGNPWTPESGTTAAHPNARFTAPASQCPVIADEFDAPDGVPISAILFGGRRPGTIPLACMARSWEEGVLMGASVSSQKTAAAEGTVGEIRHDPFAMKPFIGYNAGDYFRHWIEVGKGLDPEGAPKIFSVNWFRQDQEGNFMWPGFGDNSRVLEWALKAASASEAEKLYVDSPIGLLPAPGSIDTRGINIDAGTMEKLASFDPTKWEAEIAGNRDYFETFGKTLPPVFSKILDAMEEDLQV